MLRIGRWLHGGAIELGLIGRFDTKLAKEILKGRFHGALIQGFALKSHKNIGLKEGFQRSKYSRSASNVSLII